MKTSELDYFFNHNCTSVSARVKSTKLFFGETNLTIQEIVSFADKLETMSTGYEYRQKLRIFTTQKFNKEFGVVTE